MARDPRTVTIPRAVTLLLLLLTTAAILLVTLQIAGKTYRKVDPRPFHDVILLIEKLQEGNLAFPVLVSLVMPLLLNILLFLPWGFFLFILLDNGDRYAVESYVYIALLATAFSGAIEGIQYFQPTRVTDINDVIWNVVGAILGALAGQVRRRVRFNFV